MNARTRIIAIATTLTLTLAGLGLLPRPAEAARTWHWWDAVSAQQQQSYCPIDPPTQTQWENALGDQDDPHWTELTVYFIAYPCSGTPADFVEFRQWLNYEVHGVGTWDSGWPDEDFYELQALVHELDQYPASFFDKGPWG